MKLGYIAIDQYGSSIKLTDVDKSPRQQLMKKTGATTATKIFIDCKDGTSKHIGYIIRGMSYTVCEIHEWVGK